MHKTMDVDLRRMEFPLDYAEDEEVRFRRCTSIGEAASMILNDPNRFMVTDFFKCVDVS